jgi:hypothetical protein
MEYYTDTELAKFAAVLERDRRQTNLATRLLLAEAVAIAKETNRKLEK